MEWSGGVSKKVIMVSCPENSDFDVRLRNESARSGRPMSEILRDAFDRYVERAGTLDDHIGQEHKAVLDGLPHDTTAVIESLLKRVSPERAAELGERMAMVGSQIRAAAYGRMPQGAMSRGAADPGSRGPGVA